MNAATPPSRGVRHRGGPGYEVVGRRTMLRSAVSGVVAAGLALPLAGCGLRLDLPQPEPAVPTRRPAPDESLLVSVIRDLSQITESERAIVAKGPAGRVDPLVSTLLRLQREQVTVLTGRLTNEGVPLARIAGAQAGPLPRSTAELATRLVALRDADWAAVAGATAPSRELLTSAYSLRLAGAVLLGQAAAMPAAPSPAREAVLGRTRPLVYAFEVVAAQSSGGQRDRAVATLARLRVLERETALGSTSASTGWSLPFPVTTQASALRLAEHVMTAAIASLVDVAGPTPDATSLRDSATWGARVQSLAVEWSVPLTAFPGTQQ